VPVEYFNPLRKIKIDPSLNLEDLARVAHSLGEVVGLGLRNLAHCPVELNLMPESTLKWQSFNQKKPYLMATVFSLVLVVASVGFLFDKLAAVKNTELEKVHNQVQPQELRRDQFNKALGDLKKVQKDADQVVLWMDERYYWADVMNELRHILIKVESGMKSKLRTDTGIWIEQFLTAERRPEEVAADAGAPAEPSMAEARAAAQAAFMRRYGMLMRGGGSRGGTTEPTPAAAEPAAGGAADTTGTVRKKKAEANEVASFTITLRAVSLGSVSPEANKEVVYSVLSEVKNSPLFDPDYTDSDGKGIGAEEAPGTFTFGLVVGLKHPLKL